MVKTRSTFTSEGGDQVDKARREQEGYLFDGLSQYILRSFTLAKNHRNTVGAEEAIVNGKLAYESRYTTAEKAKYGPIAMYRGMTGMVCATAIAWLEEAYAKVEDQPWTIEPTPKPKLPAAVKARVEEAVRAQLDAIAQAGGMQPYGITNEDQYDVVRALRQAADEETMSEAKKATVGMTTVISDQLLEGGWESAFVQFRDDVVIYPTAILRAGTHESIRRASWDGDQMAIVDDIVKVSRRVAPENFFPSPDSTTTQDGEFVIERMFMPRSTLIRCTGMPSFFPEALRLVMYDYPEGVHNAQDDRAAWLSATNPNDPNMYAVYAFYGRVSGDHILSFYNAEGKADKAKRKGGTVETELGPIDPMETYEVEAWLCGGKVIRLVFAPNPLGRRPFYSTSYRKVPGTFWGQGIPCVLSGLQGELNAAARSRVFNMGIASGPQVEIDVDRLAGGQRPDQLEPWTIWYTNGGYGSGSAPAVRVNNIESNAEELTFVMSEVWSKAHDLVGLPPFTRGSNEGAAPTLGAFSMQYNNAAKGIKRVIGNVDRDVISDVIRDYYMANMFEHEDPSIKADAQVKALGVIGLLRQEAEESRLIDTLGRVLPMAERYPALMDALVSEFAEKRGFDPGKVGLASSGLERNLGPQGPADVGEPALDGRSQPAADAIAGATGPGVPS